MACETQEEEGEEVAWMNLWMEDTKRSKELDDSSLAPLKVTEEEHAHVQNHSVEDKKELTPTLQLEVVVQEAEGDLLDMDTLALPELKDCFGSRFLAAVEELAADGVDGVVVDVVADVLGMRQEEVFGSHCCY